MWIVTIKKLPGINDYRADFFPRKTYYKKDAKALCAEIARKGGEATYTKVLKGEVK